jgi:dolichol-phosphate mannosyltransferase
MNLPARLLNHPLWGAILRHRFLKFGTVGASGTVVNLVVLYLGQEFLFTGIQAPGTRLNVSLAFAIFCATLNNFSWNRRWTWRDREHRSGARLIGQFGQYALACWVGITLQAVFTKILAAHMHYLIANLSAIMMAGVVNYLVNDVWTFGRLRLLFRTRAPDASPAGPDSGPGKSAKVPAHETR